MTEARTSQQVGLPPPRSRAAFRLPHGWPVLFATGLVFVLLLVCGLLGELVAPHDPNQQDLIGRLQPPVWAGGSWDHPLGTDNLGRDILSRLIVGARISLIVVAASIPASLLLGTSLGLICGWRRGIVDRLVMRLIEVQLALPAILFAVLLAGLFGPSLRNVVVVIVLWNWAAFARLVRSEVLSLRTRDFVMAARAQGASETWIIVRHVVPNIVNVVIVVATLDVANVILAEASLSFLGAGVPTSSISWGAMVSEGRNFIAIAWWLVTVPGLAIVLLSLSGNLLGDWLRDELDPRLRTTR